MFYELYNYGRFSAEPSFLYIVLLPDDKFTGLDY